jgi:hypothetical protein
MKKLTYIISIFSILFMFINVYAEGNTAYTTVQLQDMAIKDSRQAAQDDVDIKRMEMAVRTVRSDVGAMSDSILSVTKPMEAALGLDTARRTKLDNISQLKLDVYKSVLDILLAQKETDKETQKLAIELEKLKTAQAKYKLNSITKDDLDAAQYSVDSKQLDVQSTKEKLGTYYLNLKKLVNMPLESKPLSILEKLLFQPSRILISIKPSTT